MVTPTLHTQNFFEYAVDGKWEIRSYENSDLMMRKISELIAFDDCMPVEIGTIVYNGKIVNYKGWQPGMVYEFGNSKNEIVWSREFPEWDH